MCINLNVRDVNRNKGDRTEPQGKQSISMLKLSTPLENNEIIKQPLPVVCF